MAAWPVSSLYTSSGAAQLLSSWSLSRLYRLAHGYRFISKLCFLNGVAKPNLPRRRMHASAASIWRLHSTALAVPYPFTRGESNGAGKWYVRSWASGHRGLVDQITARNSRPLRKWPAVFTPIRSKFLPFWSTFSWSHPSPRRLSRSDVILASVKGAVYSELQLFICKARSKAFFLKKNRFWIRWPCNNKYLLLLD